MKTKRVTRKHLECKIYNLNIQLINCHHEPKERQRLEAIKNHYVEKLLEMERNDLQTIEIEYYASNQ